MTSLQSTDQVPQALADAMGLGSLAFSKGGLLEIPIDDTMQLTIRRLSQAEMELVSVANLVIEIDDPASLTLLLNANHLGAGTAAGRLGLSRGEVVLRERVTVANLSVADLQARIEAFLQRVAFWSSEDARSLFAPPPPVSMNDMMSRV